MPVISAKVIKPRKQRRCDNCSKVIMPGQPTLRLYGMAMEGDRPWAVYLHPGCELSKDQKVVEAKKKAGV